MLGLGLGLVGPAPVHGSEPDGSAERVILLCEELEIRAKIRFAPGTEEIADTSIAELDQVVRILTHVPMITHVEVEGHTNGGGDAEDNTAESARLAEQVRAYLEAEGISPARLAAVGYGEAYPLVSTDHPEAASLNRRVEFRVEQEPECVVPAGLLESLREAP